MRRLPNGAPDVVVLSVAGLVVPEDFNCKAGSSAEPHACDDRSASLQLLKTLITKTIGLDIVIVWDSRFEYDAKTMKNWANDDVLLVTFPQTHGTFINHVSASFSDTGLLSNGQCDQ